MTTLEFVWLHLGEVVRTQGGIPGECVELANRYIMDVRGQPKIWANAAQWRMARIQKMLWINNTPNNVPLPGSLVIWGEDATAGTGPNGHIALVLAADTMRLVTADQNWPEGSPVALRMHTYRGVLGWQEPR